jgi:hypothetical protein
MPQPPYSASLSRRGSLMKTFAVCCAVVIATSVFADSKEAAPAGGMDMSKMGPFVRKPTNEKATKKEVEAFFKEEEALAAKGDLEAVTARIDFPVYMVTDDVKGVPEASATSKEEYIAMMKPFYENMPKDMKTTHKPNITVLSDSLVVVVDDFTMTMGKTKMSGRNSSLLIKRDGQWKWKSMVEAGWGGMAPPASAPAPSPAPSPAPTK